jgi:hypothetical protein
MRMKTLFPLAALLLVSSAGYAQDAAMHNDHQLPHDAHREAMPMKAPVPASHQVSVTFQGKTTTFTVEDLLKLPQVTVHVHNAHRNVDEDYTGPLLADLLAKAGMVANAETQPLILHSTIIATGTDKYYVVYSAAEVEPGFSNGKVIVAVTKSNGLPDTEGGAIQIVNTTDAKPARWLHGLMQINVMSLNQGQ